MADLTRPVDLNFQNAEEVVNPNASFDEASFLDRQRMAEYIKISKQNRRERKKYAEWLFNFVVYWALCVLIILLSKGRGFLNISDTLMIALLTTATANVIAMFILVIKYLFNPKKST